MSDVTDFEVKRTEAGRFEVTALTRVWVAEFADEEDAVAFAAGKTAPMQAANDPAAPRADTDAPERGKTGPESDRDIVSDINSGLDRILVSARQLVDRTRDDTPETGRTESTLPVPSSPEPEPAVPEPKTAVPTPPKRRGTDGFLDEPEADEDARELVYRKPPSETISGAEIERALTLRAEHPDWNLKRLAEEMGKSWTHLRAALAAHKARSKSYPKTVKCRTCSTRFEAETPIDTQCDECLGASLSGEG